MNKLDCCDNWKKALLSGSDNEGYGQLIYWEEEDDSPAGFYTGHFFPPIKFCPWCGHKKTTPDKCQCCYRYPCVCPIEE